MNVVVNGEPMRVAGAPSVAAVVRALGRDPSGRGLAVALNGEVVPKSAWPSTSVTESDRVEVLSATQGG